MAFLRVCIIAACAALFAAANANPKGYGFSGYGYGDGYGYGGYGYGGPGVFGAWGYGGLGAGYGAGDFHNLNAALGNAGLTIDGKGSEATLTGIAPHASLPVAETLAIPNVLALPPGRTVNCGFEWPVGISLPVGIPFAGQPGALVF